jgi:hypothetical protein
MSGGRAGVVLEETLWRHLFAANSRDEISFSVFLLIRVWLPFPQETRRAGVRRGLHRYGRQPRLKSNSRPFLSVARQRGV